MGREREKRRGLFALTNLKVLDFFADGFHPSPPVDGFFFFSSERDMCLCIVVCAYR